MRGEEKMRADHTISEQLIAIVPTPAFAVDREMKVTHINEGAAQMSNCSAEDAVGKPCHEIFPSSRCNEQCFLKRCMAEKKMLEDMESTVTFPDGRSIETRVNAAPLYDDSGVVVGGIEMLRDVTAESALTRQVAEDQERIEEYHNSTMELAMGLSECFQVLSEVRDGNMDARVSEFTLGSADEVVANLAKSLNETISEIDNQVETIRRQQFAIQELSTPILQLWDNVLALPIIGVVDTRRSADIMERLLEEVTTRQSKFVILDITGVEVVDTKTADHFIKVIKAAELLGSTCILTGIRPAVAQTLVELGIELSSIATLRNLQEGLKECLRQMGDERQHDKQYD